MDQRRGPDDDPPGQVGVTVEPNPAEEASAPAEGAPSFAADIVDLFRDRDRNSMLFAFDLRSFENVRDNAAAVLDRLQRAAGTEGAMPCDGPWPAERVAVFRRGVEGGRLP